MLTKSSSLGILIGVTLALGVYGIPATAAAADAARDTVWLRWDPSADRDVDSYVVWRCAGSVRDCPVAQDLDADPRWTRMVTFPAKDACAKTPCSGKVRDRLRAPLSYVVVAVRGSANSAASNIVTLESEPHAAAATVP